MDPHPVRQLHIKYITGADVPARVCVCVVVYVRVRVFFPSIDMPLHNSDLKVCLRKSNYRGSSRALLLRMLFSTVPI